MDSIQLTNDLVANINEFGVIVSILDMSIPATLKPSVFDEDDVMKYQKQVWKQLSKQN